MANRKKVILETPYRRMRKKIRVIRRTILIVFLLGVVCTGIFYFFRIPALQISSVSIVGTSRTDPTTLRAEANHFSEGYVFYFIPRHFFLAYPRKEITLSILEKNKQIKNIEVKLKSLHKVEISITERSPFAFYCSVSCYVADETGYVYEEASSTDGHVLFRDVRTSEQSAPLIGRYPLESRIFKDIEGFMRKLPDLLLHPQEVTIEESGDFSVFTEEGLSLIHI